MKNKYKGLLKLHTSQQNNFLRCFVILSDGDVGTDSKNFKLCCCTVSFSYNLCEGLLIFEFYLTLINFPWNFYNLLTRNQEDINVTILIAHWILLIDDLIE